MDREDLTYQFAELGDQFYYLAIVTILSFIPYIGSVAAILEFIFTFIVLGRINRLYHQLDDKDLKNFRLKIIYSYLVIIFGIIGVMIAIVGMISLFWYFMPYRVAGFLLPGTMLSILGVIVTAMILEIQAWMSLTLFFTGKESSFPKFMARDCISGITKIKHSIIAEIILFIIVISALTVIMSAIFAGNYYFYYLLPPLMIIILILSGAGMIIAVFKAIGLFKLGHLRELRYFGRQETNIKIPVENRTPVIQKSRFNKPSGTGGSFEFCPYCGERLEFSDAKFCSTCGKKIAQ